MLQFGRKKALGLNSMLFLLTLFLFYHTIRVVVLRLKISFRSRLALKKPMIDAFNLMSKNRIVIGLVGATGSGKDTVADYLKDKYKVKRMRFADPLKETLSIYFEKFSKEDQAWLAVQFRNRFGDDILSRALRKRIDNGDGIIMVNGIRFWEDFHFIKSYTRSYIIFIDVPQKLRWERTTSRGEKTDDDMSFKKFKETEQVETEKYVPEIGKKADFIIKNDKDLKHLLKEVDRVMGKITKA